MIGGRTSCKIVGKFEEECRVIRKKTFECFTIQRKTSITVSLVIFLSGIDII